MVLFFGMKRERRERVERGRYATLCPSPSSHLSHMVVNCDVAAGCWCSCAACLTFSLSLLSLFTLSLPQIPSYRGWLSGIAVTSLQKQHPWLRPFYNCSVYPSSGRQPPNNNNNKPKISKSHNNKYVEVGILYSLYSAIHHHYCSISTKCITCWRREKSLRSTVTHCINLINFEWNFLFRFSTCDCDAIFNCFRIEIFNWTNEQNSPQQTTLSRRHFSQHWFSVSISICAALLLTAWIIFSLLLHIAVKPQDA